MPTYSTVDDLLIGDLTLGSGSRPDKYVQDAADEIDACLGYRYELPLGTMPGYAQLLLKRCANLIASGRLVMALSVGGEDSAVHNYGMSLLQEGRMVLDALCSGQVDLPGAVPVDPSISHEIRGPVVVNQDPSSSMDAIYAYLWGGTCVDAWWPGVQPA